MLRRGRPGEEMGFAEGDERNGQELVVNFFFFIRKILPFSFIHFRSMPIAEWSNMSWQFLIRGTPP